MLIKGSMDTCLVPIGNLRHRREVVVNDEVTLYSILRDSGAQSRPKKPGRKKGKESWGWPGKAGILAKLKGFSQQEDDVKLRIKKTSR